MEGPTNTTYHKYDRSFSFLVKKCSSDANMSIGLFFLPLKCHYDFRVFVVVFLDERTAFLVKVIMFLAFLYCCLHAVRQGSAMRCSLLRDLLLRRPMGPMGQWATSICQPRVIVLNSYAWW